ncbi:MAG: glycosyltransferase family 2 protein [Bacteroidia bacterium]
MAIIDIDFDINRITILFEKNIPDKLLSLGKLRLFIDDKENFRSTLDFNVQYTELDIGSRLVAIMYPERFLYITFPHYTHAEIGFFVDDNFLHGEKIQFTPKLLSSSYDPVALSCKRVKLPEKVGHVAIFTQAFDEGDMLLYWEAFYGKMVGYENLYVLNNGGTDGSCARLNEKTTVINMPAGPVDHDHFAQAHGYFQRFLLLKYEWVMKTDTDEFIVCEGDLVETLKNSSHGIYAPETAVAVIHDKDNEAAFNFTGSVCEQRKHFVNDGSLLIRPTITSVPTTWTSGNHKSQENFSTLPGFFTVHLKYFDFDFLLSKNSKWALMKQTPHEEKTCVQISILSEMDQKQLYELSVNEIAARFSEVRTEIPNWLKAKL